MTTTLTAPTTTHNDGLTEGQTHVISGHDEIFTLEAADLRGSCVLTVCITCADEHDNDDFDRTSDIVDSATRCDLCSALPRAVTQVEGGVDRTTGEHLVYVAGAVIHRTTSTTGQLRTLQAIRAMCGWSTY